MVFSLKERAKTMEEKLWGWIITKDGQDDDIDDKKKSFDIE